MNSSEYELIRNMTILFFFERLIDKGSPRTVHDLSCQFGSKGFTEQMRQIAGRSQSGLKKFLSRYPSLFTIDGDLVYITSFDAPSKGNSNITPHRDYAKEAVEYFSKQIRQYGEGIEVPIKTLLGHRSQASHEVRHISGYNIAQFRDFLSNYPNDFILSEDSVILKRQPNKETKPCHELDVNTPDSTDISRLLNFIKQCTDMKEPLLVNDLYHRVQTSFPQDMWSSLFKTSQDFITFLKLHPNVFNVQGNLVSSVMRIVNTLECNYQNGSSQKTEENNKSNSNCHTTDTSSTSPSACTENITLTTNNFQKMSLKQHTTVNTSVSETIAETTEKDINISELSVQDKCEKSRVLQNTTVIANVTECLNVVENITANTEGAAISFACEGINIGVKGQLTLFQIGLTDGKAYIFDLLTCSKLVAEGGLKRLLESDKVIKVIHNCSKCSVNVYHQYGITLRNVFDTQAAHAVLQLQLTGQPIYKVQNVTLNTLCELYGSPMSVTNLKPLHRKHGRLWTQRPFTRDMLVHAALDVLSLVPQVYNAMFKQLQKDFEPLVWELSEEQVLMYIKPCEVQQHKKKRKLESEILHLRAKLNTTAHIHRNLVLSNRDIRLLRYLDLTDEEKDNLKGSYSVARKLEAMEGKERKCENEMFTLLGCKRGNSSSSENSLTGEPQSLSECMQLINDLLSDTGMNRWNKMERLEALLSSALSANNSELGGCTNNSTVGCQCSCHYEKSSMATGSQTLSTGDVVITKVFNNDKPNID